MNNNDRTERNVLDKLDLLENSVQDRVKCNEVKLSVDTSRNSLNILHINIRSIQKNFNDMLVFLESYNLNFCDIIVLSECWKIADCSNFNIEGYDTYYNNANFNQNDGIIIFSKSELNIAFSDNKLQASSVTLTKMNFRVDNITYGVTCGYRPPSTNVQWFLSDLEQYCLSGNLSSQVELFLGDINIDTLKK